MPHIPGVHLLPSTGEFTYDTLPYLGARSASAPLSPLNTFHAPGGSKTDYSYAIDQLQAAHPECGTVSLVVSWFCDGLNAGACKVYPSTTFINGTFEQTSGGADLWRCSGLTQRSAGLIPIPTDAGGSFIYGGTPSDPSIVRCIRDLKSRGLRVVFYPFLLLTSAGLPWRGRITFAPDLTSAAKSAVNALLGAASPSQFTADTTNLTVSYSGSPTDWTYRRMILHYAHLCALAGGVNLFVIGSELRGLETIRGPAWTKAGTTDDHGHAIWDYPFVAGLTALAADVRGIFDGVGLTKSMAGLTNLIAYSADWSSWMGWQHPGANGQWPHLDSLYASANIDFVSFDNYLPLSDWTTGEASLDIANWSTPKPTSWPSDAPDAIGLGLGGAPALASMDYLKANIEGGEKFHWYYDDGANDGPGLDPNGSGQYVSLPEGDRVSQNRQRYYAGQQILANKQLRWWWNNPHYAIYDDDDGNGWIAHGPQTPWEPNAKPILFLEYGVPSVDKATNQPNVFYDPKSTESFTAYWSTWDSAPGLKLQPRRDDTLSSLALQAIYDYWNIDTPANNESVRGAPMIQFAFCCVWNWDARPFPTFPLLSDVWGDASQWPWGNWLNGKGPFTPPASSAADPTPADYPTFPTISPGWSVHIRPKFSTLVSERVSGREVRVARRAYPLYDVELTYEALHASATSAELQTVAGFYLDQGGAEAVFWFSPPGLSALAGQALGIGDGTRTSFPLIVERPGGFAEAVLATSGVAAVYLDGVAQSSGFSVSLGYAPAVTFAAAPVAGATITADFGVLWLCRFAEDVADYENFLSLLWNWQSVKMQTVRP